MIILQPILHETIWGGSKLQRFIGDETKRIGHLYMVNGHKGMSNYILNGEYKGWTLEELFDIQKKNWNMEQYQEFPLTIALVDATQDLSIQVHPDDEVAKKLENKKIGKTESWIFLEEPLSGWIYGGCACDSIDEVRSAIEKNEMERVTDRQNINQWSYACVEAGTLHAMTAGSLVYEIEYGSDFTYRFYDYHRVDEQGNTRELHIDKAIEAIDPHKVPRIQPMEPFFSIRETVYETCLYRDVEVYKNQGDELACLTVLKGCCEQEGITVQSGMSCILFPGEEIRISDCNEFIVARLVGENE